MRRITIVEVGPRDGLQNERASIATADKIELVDRLSAANLPVIEVSAFVNPARVPQMADAAAVFAGITRKPGIRYTALVPNLKGLARAVDAGVTEIAIVAAATDAFSRANINQSVDESLVLYQEVCNRAAALGVRVRAYLSTAFGCPYEGDVSPDHVADLAARLVEMGAFEVAVSDTIGVAHPGLVQTVLDAVLNRVPVRAVALHLHDTRGMALANVLTALPFGVSTFDASVGGLGGCPFAPGAAGNLATSELLYMLNGLNIDTGVSLEGLSGAATFIASKLDRPLASRYAQAEAARSAQRLGASASSP